MQREGITPVLLPDLSGLATASHILSTVTPDSSGDPILNAFQNQIKDSPAYWLGYLSTTGVYGDHHGAWIDEASPCHPTSTRSQQRLAAEQAWQALPQQAHIFRLAGIYGPGRNVLADLKAGTARRIDKPGHIFNRIHVADIVQTLLASMQHPNPGAIYNLADDLPASSREVMEYAAELLQLPPPPVENAATASMSLMLQNFYAESKRVRNLRIKGELQVVLKYPDYREGLKALLINS